MVRSLVALIALAGTAAAKPVWRPKPPRPDVNELALHVVAAVRARDAGAVQQLLAEVVMHDPLWFPDAACAKQFGTKGTIEKGKVRALARCLAKLRPIATTRRSALSTGAILTFDPGIEIEVVFKEERIQWLGAPRLTAQALEALRTGGSTQLDAALEGKLATAPASAWIEVCLDKTGAATKRVVDVTPGGATSDIFVAAVADWSFKPFRAPICALSLVSYPASSGPATETLPPSSPPVPNVAVADVLSELTFDDITFVGVTQQNVPPTLLERNRVAGVAKIEPDAPTKAAIAKSKAVVTASVKLCIDTNGAPTTLLLLKSSGYPAYDRKLTTEMRGWRYKPYLVNGVATDVCTAVTFIHRP